MEIPQTLETNPRTTLIRPSRPNLKAAAALLPKFVCFVVGCDGAVVISCGDGVVVCCGDAVVVTTLLLAVGFAAVPCVTVETTPVCTVVAAAPVGVAGANVPSVPSVEE